MRRPRPRIVWPFLAILGWSACSGSSLGEGASRPSIVEDIERRLDGFYLFTTAGDGAYRLYQRLEGPLGVSGADEIVCLAHQCYLAAARASTGDLDRIGGRSASPEAVRRRFRAARDAYNDLLRAPPAERRDAVQTWRRALADIEACLAVTSAC